MSEISNNLFTNSVYDKTAARKNSLPKYATDDWSEEQGKEYASKYNWNPETYKVKRDPRTGLPYYDS